MKRRRSNWHTRLLVALVAASTVCTAAAVVLPGVPGAGLASVPGGVLKAAAASARPAPKWSLARTPGATNQGEAPLPGKDLSGAAPASNPLVDLQEVDCATTRSCVAVGDYEDVNGYFSGLIEMLSGGSWHAQVAPMPALSPDGTGPGTDSSSHGFSVLFSVSCPSPRYCVAVGSYHDADGRPWALAEVYSGNNWSPYVLPQPGRDPSDEMPSTDPEAEGMSSVACPAPGVCVAGGAYQDQAHYDYGLLETLSGGKWRAAVAPQPAVSAYGSPSATDSDTYQFAGVGSVACAGVAFCLGVGYYKDSGGDASGLIDTWSKGHWSALAAPEPSSDASGAKAYTSDKGAAYGALTSVSCTYQGYCAAVGSYRDSTGHNYGLVDTLDKGRWRPTAAPLPGRDYSGKAPGNDKNKEADASLTAVACPAGRCVTVGFYKDSTGHFTGLVDTQGPRAWDAVTAPVPGRDRMGGGPGQDGSGLADTEMTSVSCIAVGRCVSVGTYNDTKGNSVGLIDMVSNGHWQAVAVPAPLSPLQVGLTPRQSVNVNWVSCTPAATCALVGSYQDLAGDTFGLIDSYGP